jgi:exonuclease SbcC
VLPQGDFAQFLHATGAERQRLLVQLLGAEIYRAIGQAANQRASAAEGQAAILKHRLDRELAGATEDALEAAKARADSLAKLLERIESEKPALDAANDERERAARSAQESDARAKLLESVSPPAGIEGLARTIADATSGLAAADAALNVAVAAREAAERQREALPERARVESSLEKHERRAALEGQLEAAGHAVAEAKRETKKAATALAKADAAFAESDERLQHLQREHAAAHLAQYLVAGDACPVCLQEVAEVPPHEPPTDLETARKQRARAEEAKQVANTAAQKAVSTEAAREAAAEGLRAQVKSLAAELTDVPAPDSLRVTLQDITRADQALREARAQESGARDRQQRAQTAAVRAEDQKKAGRQEFNRARDALASQSLLPPAAAGEDLGEDWRTLTEWARAQARAQRQQAEAKRAAETAAATRYAEMLRQQAEACAALGVEVGKRDPRAACADAHMRATAQAERLAHEMATAAELRVQHARFARDADIAKVLGRHMNANNFERWLMRRALLQLVAGASRVLRELSDNGYSLDIDDKSSFVVIDHRNADERRWARTLSGGETFLASLALALALADQIASLSAGGAASLDALFLDEGFGTLDPETLETVAGAIEELGSRGRMVGIVTHVRELAERVPIRFEVRKVNGTSSVQKVIV